MLVIGHLSLFGGEIIISDCVVPLKSLIMIMFSCYELFPMFLRAYDELAMIFIKHVLVFGLVFIFYVVL
jgi:hypothetical protein